MPSCSTPSYLAHLLTVHTCEHNLITFPQSEQTTGKYGAIINHVTIKTQCILCGYVEKIVRDQDLVSDGKTWSIRRS